MKTALIRVTAGAGGYDLQLFAEQDGVADWLDEPLASSTAPGDLAAMEAPADVGNGPLEDRIRRFVLDQRESGAFEDIGEHLAKLIFRGDVATRWDALAGAGGFRTLLEIDPDNLRLLPWELMSRDGALFVEQTRVFARVRKFVDDSKQELVPIRLLVVEGERDDETIGTQDEIRAIKLALPKFGGGIEAEFLTEPSESELRAACQRIRPHIFHFIGHGMRHGTSKEPALRVRDRSGGRTWPLTRRYVRDVLRPTPRVAILNACRSGDLEGVRALTDAFLDRNAAAVIGMQGDIRGQAAAMFGSGLYQALAGGELIDEAVTSARNAVYTEVGVTRQERDWFLPSLTLRVRPEQVLPVTYGISEDERRWVEDDLYKKIRLFVDRTKERGKLAAGVDPDDGTPGRLLVVTGDQRTGKTWLLHWIRMRCALRGRRVKYVDFRGEGNLNFLPALLTIRDTSEDVARLAAAADAFDRFNYDLTFLAEGKLTAEPIGEVPKVPPPGPDTRLQSGPVNAMEYLFGSFRGALNEASSSSQLILILDHVDGLLKGAFLDYLYPHLIRKVFDGELPNVRVVLGLSTEQRRDYWPSGEARIGEWVDVDLVPSDRYLELLEDLLLAMGRSSSPDKDFIQAAAAYVREPWPMYRLAAIPMLVGGGDP
jgi:hypothetical protein